MRKVKNRRFQSRIPWEGMVSYRRSVPHRRASLREIHGQGKMQNVSGGGICLLTETRLSPRQFLTITVPLSFSGPAIPTLAYVQWTRPLRGTAQYEAGLSFLS